MMRKYGILISVVTLWACLTSVRALADTTLPAGTVTAGGVVVLPQLPNTGGFVGALGQLAIGHSDDGTLWSGLITPDVIGPAIITDIIIPDNLTGAPGATVTVPVYLKGLSPFAGLQAFVSFDKDKLTYVGGSIGPLVSMDPDWEIDANLKDGNELHFIVLAKTALKTATPDETKAVALLQLKIAASVSAGTSLPLSFVPVTTMAAENADRLPMRWVHGAIKVGVATPQPDLLIKKDSESTYAGNDLYPTVPVDPQIKKQVVPANVKAVFQVKVENDGGTPRAFGLKAAESGLSGWTPTVYKYGASTISAAIKTGWTTPTLNPGDSVVITVELKPTVTTPEGNSASTIINAYLGGTDKTVRDSVKCIATKLTRRPDLQIRSLIDSFFTGNNVYNTTGMGQSRSQSAVKGMTATYILKVENDGNDTDSFKVTGTPSAASWTIRYYDASTGGSEITSSVVSAGGWKVSSLEPGTTREFRVEVTSTTTVATGVKKDVLVTAASTGDLTKKDVVKASTTATKIRTDRNGEDVVEIRWVNAPPVQMVSGMNYLTSWEILGGASVSRTCLVLSTDPEPTKKPLATTDLQAGTPGVFKAWVPGPSSGGLYYQAVAVVDGKPVLSEIVYCSVD